jgi:hypothetical protein
MNTASGYWCEEWESEWDHGSGTAVKVRAEALAVNGHVIAGLRVYALSDDGGGRDGGVLTIEQAEALLAFLQAQVPEIRQRMEGLERDF